MRSFLNERSFKFSKTNSNEKFTKSKWNRLDTGRGRGATRRIRMRDPPPRREHRHRGAGLAPRLREGFKESDRLRVYYRGGDPEDHASSTGRWHYFVSARHGARSPVR